MFYDLRDKEIGDTKMNLERANQTKRAYRYTMNWSPSMEVEYCINLNHPPFNFVIRKSIIREEFSDVIPYDRPDTTLSFEP
jgi:hypothetical protein